MIPISRDNSVSLRRIWTKLRGNYSYKSRGAYYTTQGPQKQLEMITNNFCICSQQQLHAQTLILVSFILVKCLGLFNFTRNGFLRC